MLIQLETTCAKPKPRRLFYSFAHKDEALRDMLSAHLTLLKREGFIHAARALRTRNASN